MSVTPMLPPGRVGLTSSSGTTGAANRGAGRVDWPAFKRIKLEQAESYDADTDGDE